MELTAFEKYSPSVYHPKIMWVLTTRERPAPPPACWMEPGVGANSALAKPPDCTALTQLAKANTKKTIFEATGRKMEVEENKTRRRQNPPFLLLLPLSYSTRAARLSSYWSGIPFNWRERHQSASEKASSFSTLQKRSSAFHRAGL